MHALDGVGIIHSEIDSEITQIKSKGVAVLPSSVNDFYLVDLSKKKSKKVLANAGVNYVLSVWTDYFGGCGGEQGSKLIHLTQDYTLRAKPQKFSSINQGLSKLGVKEDDSDLDLFDLIGLGKFRTHHDFIEQFDLSKLQVRFDDEEKMLKATSVGNVDVKFSSINQSKVTYTGILNRRNLKVVIKDNNVSKSEYNSIEKVDLLLSYSDNIQISLNDFVIFEKGSME